MKQSHSDSLLPRYVAMDVEYDASILYSQQGAIVLEPCSGRLGFVEIALATCSLCLLWYAMLLGIV